MTDPLNRAERRARFMAVVDRPGRAVVVAPLPVSALAGARTPRNMRPVHPGEVFREEWRASKRSFAEVAAAASLPLRVVEDLWSEGVSVTKAIASGLARALGTTADFWTGLQEAYDERVEALVVLSREAPGTHDSKWIADVPSHPGVMAYGRSGPEATRNVLALLAETRRLQDDEAPRAPRSVARLGGGRRSPRE